MPADRPQGQTGTRIRRWWTEEEDEVLCREADYQLAQGSLRDWNRIAAKLPGRTNKDCRKRWSKVCKDVRKGAWSSAEDQRLQHAVQQSGYRWTHVAETVGTRHADQCAKRWQHFLDPNLDHSEWVQEDDERLIAAVDKYGRKWKIIGEKEFPGRSATDLKNRHVILERKRSASQSNQSSASNQSTAAAITQVPSASTTNVPDMTDGSLNSSDSMRDDNSVDFNNDFNLGLYSGSVSPTTQTPSGMQTPYCTGADGTIAPIQLKDLSGSLPMIPDLEDPNHMFTTSPEAFGMGHPAMQHHPFASHNPSLDLSHAESPWAMEGMPTPQQTTSTHSGIHMLPQLHTNMDMASAMGKEDGDLGLCDPMDPRSTLILEDVQPDMVNNIMNVLFTSKSKVRMKLFSQEA